MVFQPIAESFGDILGVSATEGGYIAGLILVIVLIVIFLIVAEDHRVILFMGFVGTVVNVLVGWFPIWVPILMFFFFAFMLINPTDKGE